MLEELIGLDQVIITMLSLSLPHQSLPTIATTNKMLTVLIPQTWLCQRNTEGKSQMPTVWASGSCITIYQKLNGYNVHSLTALQVSSPIGLYEFWVCEHSTWLLRSCQGHVPILEPLGDIVLPISQTVSWIEFLSVVKLRSLILGCFSAQDSSKKLKATFQKEQ